MNNAATAPAATYTVRDSVVVEAQLSNREVRALVEEWTAAHLAWVASPVGTQWALDRHAERERAYVTAWRKGVRISRGTLPA